METPPRVDSEGFLEASENHLQQLCFAMFFPALMPSKPNTATTEALALGVGATGMV